MLALYFLFDPSTSLWAPKCTFRLITGLDCPGCGAQRMLHALLHGDWQAAWSHNAFLLCILPVIGIFIAAALLRRRLPRFYAAVNSLPVILATAISIVLWGILRNML